MFMCDICICCGTRLQLGLCDWHRVCPRCKYERSHLVSFINAEFAPNKFDENLREVGLMDLRKNNFKQLVDEISKYAPHDSTLLDVGCGHGWFLEIANKKFKAEGIEPDRAIYERALKHGFNVRCGYFPKDLSITDVYDVIIFNDVIEHIHDIHSTMDALRKHLNNEGLLVLNLPSRGGIFYRLSKVLYYFGARSFFERLWQTEMPSPHIHYFNRKNLTAFLSKAGFKVSMYGRLESIIRSGLYARISYARSDAKILNKLLYIVIACFLPLLRLLPSDIIYVIATRK